MSATPKSGNLRRRSSAIKAKITETTAMGKVAVRPFIYLDCKPNSAALRFFAALREIPSDPLQRSRISSASD